MKKPQSRSQNLRVKKVACTVSAAALMLGVSQAATVGLHFQENYCGSPAYSGFPVTLTAFGVPPSSWENLTAMDTGYGPCAGPLGYTLNQVISTNTSTGGLNPLPSGTLSINWFGPTANFSGFGGYAGDPPSYNYSGPYPNGNTTPTGEEQVYATFIRDGVNFGPGGSGADNNQPGYSVDITGLKSLFPTSPFVIELIASSDSMQALTNAFVVDATAGTTNSVTYPRTPTVNNAGSAPWVRGQGGGLSTATGAINTDHVKIMSNIPAHGGTGTPPDGFDNAGTISGFIITDKPVITMSPRAISGAPGDLVTLNPYTIGVPPLVYQWRQNGHPISGATASSYTIPGLTLAGTGSYDFVVTNNYGSATSQVAVVTADIIKVASGRNFVNDTNPNNTPHAGTDNGATWLATSSDGTVNRAGVMQFVAANKTEITVPGSTDLDVPTGTVTLWMRSVGTDGTAGGNIGAALFGRTFGNSGNDFELVQMDSGSVLFNAPGGANQFTSAANVGDNQWHFIAVTFDQSAAGGAALYIDGIPGSTNGNSLAWSWPVGKPIELGVTSDTYWRPYDGLLDDVRVYSRQLTAAEIASVYNTGALVDTAKLQLRLNFDAAPGLGFSLTWNAANTILQSASNVSGPYLDVLSGGNSYNVVPQGAQKFYRYRNTPQAVVSNPYLM